MTFRKMFLVVIALAVVFAVSGCKTKNLTPASAKHLLQAKYRAEDRSTGVVPYGPFRAAVNGRYATDFQPDHFQRNTQLPAGSQVAKMVAMGEDMLHRLIKAGFVKEVPVGNAMYQCSPTQDVFKFVIDSTPDGMLKLGDVHVDSVDNLFLGDTDTSAEGEYTWHVDYNDMGRAVMGEIKKQGSGHVHFRKQPDGTWVCDSFEVTSEHDQ